MDKIPYDVFQIDRIHNLIQIYNSNKVITILDYSEMDVPTHYEHQTETWYQITQ